LGNGNGCRGAGSVAGRVLADTFHEHVGGFAVCVGRGNPHRGEPDGVDDKTASGGVGAIAGTRVNCQGASTVKRTRGGPLPTPVNRTSIVVP
jgi:hypothetical protein